MTPLQRGKRLRRARSLVAYWDGGEFTLENYLCGSRACVAPVVCQCLARADRFVSFSDLAASFRQVPRIGAILDQLRELGFLLEENSAAEQRDRALADGWAWGHPARLFHFHTQRVRYEPDLDVQRESVRRLARAHPPPSPYKRCGTEDLHLLDTLSGASDALWKTLLARRTRRDFTGAPISLAAFTRILQWTWGKSHAVNRSEIGPYLLKTSPSGGARHAIEVYPVVLRVQGVEPGLYHYSVERHSLELLEPGPFAERVVAMFAHQRWVEQAAAVFFMTAVVGRSMWKYRHDHAYRVLLLDAGHLGQTFHLVCTRLGLAPFTSSAKDDTAIEQALGIDGIREISLYAAAVGRGERGRRSRRR